MSKVVLRSLRGLSILVGEDNQAIREMLVVWLTTAGATVTAVSTGNEVVELLNAGRPAFDLLLTDHLMPGGTAVESLAAAASISPRPRVVVLTGVPDRSVHDLLSLAGADAVVMKPFSLLELLAVLMP